MKAERERERERERELFNGTQSVTTIKCILLTENVFSF